MCVRAVCTCLCTTKALVFSQTESEEGEVESHDQSHDVPVVPPSVLDTENSMGLPDDEVCSTCTCKCSTTHSSIP